MRRGSAATAAALLLIFASLASWCAFRQSATWDETAHLAAGYSYLKWGDYRLNPEHPPLLKMLAALPLLPLRPWPEAVAGGTNSPSLAAARAVWARAFADPNAQWVFGHHFLYGMKDETLRRHGALRSHQVPTTAALAPEDFHNDAGRMLFLGRLPMIALAVLLGLLIYLWARELHGAAGAALALALYCFDPNFIAHAGLVTTDTGTSLFVFGAVYFFWRACRRPSAGNTAVAACCVAAAFASKFSAVLLIPILGTLAALQLRGGRRRGLAAAVALGFAFAAAYGGVWLAYGARYAPSPTGGGFPLTEALSAPASGVTAPALRLLQKARLLPEAYLYGVASAGMKSRELKSYLFGRFSDHGFPGYHLATILLKTPLPALALIAAAIVLAARRRSDVAFLIIPAVIWLAAASLSRYNIGHRHLLPMYPFLFVLCGGLAEPWSRLSTAARRRSAAVVLALVAASPFVVFSPPWRPALVYPHILSYINELGGGPRNGWRLLADSNIDWGQDLAELGVRLKRLGIVEPVNLCYFGTADPRYHGIAHINLPGGSWFVPQADFNSARRPGYLAISANGLAGVFYEPALREAWADFLKDAVLVDRIGYSLFLFRLP